MINFTDRIKKFEGNGLKDGENIISTLFVQPDGFFKDAMVKASFGLLGALFASKMKGKATETHKSAMVSKLPESAMLFAVTNQRILVYLQNSFNNKVVALHTDFARGDIQSIEAQSKFWIMKSVTIRFKDGGTISFEAGPGQNINQFISEVTKK